MAEPISAIKHVVSITKAIEMTRAIKRLKAENSRLRNVLLGYEEWEASLLTDDGHRVIEAMPTCHYNRMMKLQAQRNTVLDR